MNARTKTSGPKPCSNHVGCAKCATNWLHAMKCLHTCSRKQPSLKACRHEKCLETLTKKYALNSPFASNDRSEKHMKIKASVIAFVCRLIGHAPTESDWRPVDNNYLPPYYVKWTDCKRCKTILGKKISGMRKTDGGCLE